MELNEEEDEACYDWFYDHRHVVAGQPLGGARRWRLSLAVMANLYRLAGVLLSDL